ncbi:MAG: FHIPEP family type III secretion protein, partial [Thiobacillus sp.]|nr:FHIPEP family type III secretion protein [Thiobacillus sp.]
TLGLEVGYRLIPLVDNAADGELVRRIKGIRKKFAREIGFLPPAVHIRDNLEINPNSYRITLKGVEIGSGEVRTGLFLAIDPGSITGTLPGVATTDPAFGLPAVWIESNQREQAQAMGYTVVDPGTVVATHLNHLVTQHAAELLGRQEVQALLDHLGKSAPKLVEELVPKMLTLSAVQKVLQTLLIEGVAIRDMRSIIDTLLEHGAHVQDPNELTALVRVTLGRSIVQQIYGSVSELPVIALDQTLERLLLQTLQAGHDAAGMEPGLADTLLEKTQTSTQRQEALGHPPVLLTPAVLRPLLARFLRRAVPQLKVLSHAEVPEGKHIKVTSLVGGAA